MGVGSIGSKIPTEQLVKYLAKEQAASFNRRKVSKAKDVPSFLRPFQKKRSQSGDKDVSARKVEMPVCLKNMMLKRLNDNQWATTVSKGGIGEAKWRNAHAVRELLEGLQVSNPRGQLKIEIENLKNDIKEREYKYDEISRCKKGRGSFKQVAGYHQAVNDKIVIKSVKVEGKQLIARLAQIKVLNDVKLKKQELKNDKSWAKWIAFQVKDLLGRKVTSYTVNKAKKGLGKELHKKVVNYKNELQWQTVTSELTLPPSRGKGPLKLLSIQTPASKIQAPALLGAEKGSRDIFMKSYQGKGVCSGTSYSRDHAVNLWTSSYQINGKTYSWVRSGTLGAYGLEKKKDRKAAADVRARETVTAALTLKPGLLGKYFENPKEPIKLNLASMSLLSPTKPLMAKLSGNKVEADMLKEQIEAFQRLENGTLKLAIMGRQGNTREVQVELSMACFNFGVNQVAVDWFSDVTGGWGTADSYNKKALTKLTGSLARGPGELGGWVQDALYAKANAINDLKELSDLSVLKKSQKIKELKHEQRIITQLATQVREIFQTKSYKKDEHEAYKISARLQLLTSMIDGVPLSNCKSGKDRTGMLDAETKLLATLVERDGIVPEPGAPLAEGDREIFQDILLNSGNFEIQEYNTGLPGYKTEGVKSIYERIGNDMVRAAVRGGSGAVSS